MPALLTYKQALVFQALSMSKQTCAQLAKKTGLTCSQVSSECDRLHSKGLILRTGGSKTTGYKLTDYYRTNHYLANKWGYLGIPAVTYY